MANATYAATGRRKCSIARVRLTPGKGEFKFNGKYSIEQYFPRITLRAQILKPLEITGCAGKYNIFANLDGGGVSGQAGALTLGIARALIEINPEFRGDLKRAGLLTRDSRVVERKKYGFKKARKKPQFTKR